MGKWWICFADVSGSNPSGGLKNGVRLGYVMWYKVTCDVCFYRNCVNVVGWSLGGCYGWE